MGRTKKNEAAEQEIADILNEIKSAPILQASKTKTTLEKLNHNIVLVDKQKTDIQMTDIIHNSSVTREHKAITKKASTEQGKKESKTTKKATVETVETKKTENDSAESKMASETEIGVTVDKQAEKIDSGTKIAELNKCLCCKKKANNVVIINDEKIYFCDECLFDFQVLLQNFRENHNVSQKNKYIKISLIEQENENIFYRLNLQEHQYDLTIERLETLLKEINEINYCNHISNPFLPKYLIEFANNILESWNKRKEQEEYNSIIPDYMKQEYADRWNINRFIHRTIYFSPKHLSYDESYKKYHFSISRHNCISGINCSVCKKDKSARLVLISSRPDYFNFSFCLSCLWDLSSALLKFLRADVLRINENNIFIEKQEANEKCFGCGQVYQTQYYIKFQDKSVVFCSKCFIRLIETVLTSITVRELFPKIFDEYKMIKKELKNGILEDEKKLKQEIKSGLQKHQIQHAKRLKKMQELTLLEKIQPFDCIHSEHLNFVLKKKEIDEYKIGKLKIINTTYFDCLTLPHETPEKAVAVLTSNRSKKRLNLSVCKECSQILYQTMLYADQHKCSISNKEKNVKIKYHEKFPKELRCSFCGTENGHGYSVKLGNCHYHLCEQCFRKHYSQFETISTINSFDKNYKIELQENI